MARAVAQDSNQVSRIQDALTAALLFAGLATLFAFTRSHWLDDWDSVNFALAPMLVGLNQREIKQIAQGLLFELS